MARKSGFSAPMIGIVEPKGSKIKKNKDGTVTVVPPKKPAEKGDKS